LFFGALLSREGAGVSRKDTMQLAFVFLQLSVRQTQLSFWCIVIKIYSDMMQSTTEKQIVLVKGYLFNLSGTEREKTK